ncbi:MAG TPA: SfnB family sulfur acquisition oxidoreductase [Solirubrobacterales bacterium]|nr:SfnB family sulfur acquisition oxidoreductase [Solirubrobacterales bacterium]
MSVAAAPAARRIVSDEEAIAAAREYAATIAPGAAERDRERRVPVVELEQLGQTGLLALGIPAEHGGPGARVETIVEVFRTISAADPAIGQVPQNHYQLVDAVVRYGDAAQRELLLGEVLAGARFGNALSERGGKTPIDLRTELREDGNGGYRLNGRKYYSTGALTAQWVPVLGVGEDGAFAFVYVPRDAEGLSVEQDWTAFGQRATISGTTLLEDVAVRPEWVIWLPQREVADTFSSFAQILHAAVDVGIARGALEDAVRHLDEHARVWFEAEVERPAEEPYVVAHFGRLQVRVRAAEALLADAARRLDLAAGGDPEAILAARLGVAEARAFGAETALHVASEALDTLGASAADEGYGLDRHWRNARTHTLHDPTRWKYVHIGRHLVAGIDPAADNFLI